MGNLPEEKALGVKWDTQNDTLGFYIKFADKPLTRRGLLSTLSSVYDPLGLAAPFLLKGRQIIQQLCRNRLNWDEPIDERSSYEWQKWKNNLSMVEDIKIHRCYKPHGFERIINYSLHHFSDASECGYGQATYLRMVNDLEEVHCSLIFKSCTGEVCLHPETRVNSCHLVSKNLKDVERGTGHPYQF